MCHPEIPEGAEIPIVTTEEVLVPVPGGDHMPALVALPESGSGPGVLSITDFFGRAAFYELIAARLAQAPKRPTIVFMPHPPFRTGLAIMDSIGLLGADAFARVVAQHDRLVGQRFSVRGHGRRFPLVCTAPPHYAAFPRPKARGYSPAGRRP